MARQNKWFYEDVETMVEMRGRGMSYKEIAETFGSTEKSISVIVSKYRGGKTWPQRSAATGQLDRRRLIDLVIEMDIDKSAKIKVLSVLM